MRHAAAQAQSAVTAARGAVAVLTVPSSQQQLSEQVQQALTDEGGYLQAVSGTLSSPGGQSASQLQTLATSAESSLVEAGFFTRALIEGLSGRADANRDGVVHLHELDAYAARRVRDLSEGRQHPVTARPAAVRSFPLTRP